MSAPASLRSALLAAFALVAAGPSPSRGEVQAEPERAPAGEGEAREAEPGEEIVVTGVRTARPRRDVPVTVTVLPRAEIERSPTKTTDELLRIVPSFGLFRRSSSVVSDPTAQGANLRGIGPSGVSRSLVLLDGVPENDAFGGWVYWRALPRIGIERIEVVPGGGSALYGNYALGGVTQVLSRPIAARSVDGTATLGALGTGQLSVRAADVRGPIAAMVEAEGFRSDGYLVVAPGARGPVDSPASSRHGAAAARVEVSASPELSLFLRAGAFREDQDGGTRYTTAEVSRLGWAAGARWEPGRVGRLDLGISGHRSGFEQDRARIVPDRTQESLAARQDVPSWDAGAEALWTGPPLPLAGRHVLTVGADVRRVDGDPREDLFPPSPTATSVVRREIGATQRLGGVFAQDLWDLSDALAASLAVRWDRWEAGGTRLERLQDGSSTSAAFARHGDDALSPKVGVRLRALDGLVLRASAYRAFRAPTLNELYRPFQVGAVRTEANEDLGPETLRGADAGVEVLVRPGIGARVTGFWNELDDPVTNVTIGTNLRQRQNLGRARVRGVEAELSWRAGRSWLGTAAYTFVEPVVTRAPGQPQLVGMDLAQDPRHRVCLSLSFHDPGLLSATVQARYSGRQYEDDLNTLPMGGVLLVDVSASRRIGPNLELVLAVENLLDRQYLVGRAGVDTIGQPRFVHAGVVVRFGG